MQKFKIFQLLSTVILIASTGHSSADWSLNTKNSSIQFISIKKETIAEVHQFKAMSGVIKTDGEFTLSVNLSSVDTGVPVRDKNLQDSLFEILKFPVATGKGKVSPSVISNLKKGEVTLVETPFMLSLHGVNADLNAKVNVVKLSPSTLWITSAAPIIINTASFNLESGVNKLKELVTLPSIAYAVPVNLNLFFEEIGTVKPDPTKANH
jgi:polyisoprenoid-binding protein YceI